MSIGDGSYSDNSIAARHCRLLLETGVYRRPAFIRDPALHLLIRTRA